ITMHTERNSSHCPRGPPYHAVLAIKGFAREARARGRGRPASPLDGSAAAWTARRAGTVACVSRSAPMKSTLGRPRSVTDEQVTAILQWHAQILAWRAQRSTLKTKR